MRPRTPVGVGGIVVLTLLGLAALFYLLRPAGSEVVVDDAGPIDPPGPGVAVIASVRASGGFSIFGIRLTDPTYFAEVQFVTEAGCAGLVESGDPWPTPHSQCPGPAEIAGEVSGLGRTASGDALIGVRIEVPKACHRALTPGMGWPPDLQECRPGT